MAMILDEKTWGLSNISASILDEKTWDAIQVGTPGPIPPPPGVEGLIKDLRFWNVDKWQTIPPSVAVGGIVGVKATGRNTGYALDSMTMNAVIDDPDGERIATETVTQDWVGTGVEILIECSGTKTKEGNYTAYIELIVRYAGLAYVLDTWEGAITVAVTEGGFPWKYVGIGVGVMSAILLIPAKKKK